MLRTVQNLNTETQIGQIECTLQFSVYAQDTLVYENRLEQLSSFEKMFLPWSVQKNRVWVKWGNSPVQ